jgi:hypothetical protein
MRTRFAMAFIVLFGLQVLLYFFGRILGVARLVGIIYHPFFTLVASLKKSHSDGDLAATVFLAILVGAFVYYFVLAGLVAAFIGGRQQPRDPDA